MVVWANLHGGFVYGLAVVGLAAVTETVLWLVSPRGRRPPPPIAPALGGACRLRGGGPAQPDHHPRLPGRHPGPDQRGAAELHRRVAVAELPLAVVRLGLELLLLLVVAAMALRRPRLWDALLTVVGIYAALSAVRNAPVAAALLIPMVAWSLGGAWERSRWRDRFAEWMRRRASDLLILVSAGALIVTVATVGHRGQHPEQPDGEHRRQLPGGGGQLAGGAPQRRHPDVQRLRLGRLPHLPLLRGRQPPASSSTARRPRWATRCSSR